MALTKVVPGQKITASLFNEVIDGINGGSSGGNGNTSILQNSTSFFQYPPDWVNNYKEDLLHSWTLENEWTKLGPLSIKDPLVVINNDIRVAELDEDCSESGYNNYGRWYCGVRKDLLGESLDDSEIEQHTQEIIYTNTKSGKYNVYIFQDVFDIFYHQTPTSPCIYTFRNIPPMFYSYSGGGESGKYNGYPALFDYEEATESETYLDESGSEHERVATNHYVVRNIFYYNDQEESLPDYKVLDKDSIVYLHVQYPLDAESKPDKTHKPTFFINETGATTGDYAYRLWELDDWNVKCDCRTALVPLYNPWEESESESEKDVLVVAKGPFEPIYQNNDSTKKVTGLRNCVFQWERRFLDMGQQTLALPQSECWILLEITHPTTPQGGDVWPVNYRIRFETVNPFNNQNGLLLNVDDTITLIPLYKLSVNGTVLEDYRAVPVAPVYR